MPVELTSIWELPIDMIGDGQDGGPQEVCPSGRAFDLIWGLDCPPTYQPYAKVRFRNVIARKSFTLGAMTVCEDSSRALRSGALWLVEGTRWADATRQASSPFFDGIARHHYALVTVESGHFEVLAASVTVEYDGAVVLSHPKIS